MNHVSCGRIEPLEGRRLLSVVPVGGEFPVNQHTPNHQVAPRVATAADGSFVVVWSSSAQVSPASGRDIYARRYAADGSPITGEFLVNVYTTSDQSMPAVAMDDAENFVVAWTSYGQDGAASGVYARRYDAAALPVSDEFRVNSYTGGDEAFAAIAMDSDGDFVITWDTFNPSAGALYDVYAQRYDAQGQPTGGEMRVNTTFSNHEYGSTVAMDSDGDYVVFWQSDAQDGSQHGIYGQRFGADGQKRGSEFRANTFTAGNQLFPSAAMDADGDFVVAWQSDSQDGSLAGIYAQRYNVLGKPQGDEFIVNTYTTAQQEGPAVAMDDAGNFIVVWESFGPDQSRLGVRARAFRAAGVPVGDEFGVNTYVIDDQAFAHVSIDPDGDTIIAWQSRYQDGSENGLFARRYRFDVVAPTVAASEFRYQTSPHMLKFTFSENVAASLTSDDLTVVDLAGGPPIPATFSDYDASTNTASFTITNVLRDGRFRATLAASGVTDAGGNPLAADHLFDFHFLRGDANHDARVNLSDFNILAANFGQSGPSIDFSRGDFNYDRTVNLSDFNLLASRFGTTLAPGSSDDESSSRIADDVLT